MRVFTAARCLDHQPGDLPERPARLRAVLDALTFTTGTAPQEASEAPLDLLTDCHTADYIGRLRAMSDLGTGAFDADTPVAGETWPAALAAVGAGVAALDHAMESGTAAFAAVRPPGHHALADRAMGFCYLNTIALMAAAARRKAAENVLIIDWDVHHGNGTQALVEQEPRTRFVSMHQWPWYPGTGSADDRGCGNCFNVPLAPGLPPEVYLEALWGGITAATRDWSPDVVLVSAGFDCMYRDPLGGFTLEPEHFATWARRLRERFPKSPIAMTMEGGYAPNRLADGVVATVGALE